MQEALILITIAALLLSLILWRIITAQNNKAQAAFASHRKEHNEVLAKTKAERRELKLLLNAFDDALIITNSAGIIQVANEATRKICNGKPLRGNSIVTNFLDKEVCQHLQNAIASNQPFHEKIFLTNSSFGNNGIPADSAWVIDAAPLSSQDEGSLYRIILRNITAEYQADQVKREFVANASHELRTPLAVINGYLENLIDDDVLESPETSRRFLTTIRKHSKRISTLIEEMLNLSKLESGEATSLNIKPFSLDETLKDIIDRLSPIAMKQGANFELKINPQPITLQGDQFYWDQSIFNLIENALKQNREKPILIKVTAEILDSDQEQGQDQVEISITDNGKGISSKHIPYLFNRFYRVQKHHSQNEVKGTGLGLSIVKHAIEAHGGKVSVKSQPGVFTTFTINCPLKQN